MLPDDLAALARLATEQRNLDAQIGGADFQEDHGPPLDAEARQALDEVIARRAVVCEAMVAIFDRNAGDAAWDAHRRAVLDGLRAIAAAETDDQYVATALITAWERWLAGEAIVGLAAIYAQAIGLLMRYA
ncbi:MAG: hypothetical protein K8W52_21140 [Deltaproteobacteria bacterium]|nr:hypothetical protein [Deltaproteobacteria bacterium]